MVFLAAVQSAVAVAWTWNGNGGNANWITTGNWTPGSTPASAATTDLYFDGTTNTGTAGTPLNQNITAPFLVNSITFNLGAGNFFLGVGALRFDGGTTNTIVQNSPNAQSIANPINAPSNNSPVTLTLAGSGAGIVTISGVISSANGSRDYAITKTGTSTFVLSGVNTYGGLTTISGGVLNIQNAAALGGTTAGTTVASGAALQIQNGITVGAETLTLNGSGVAADGALRNISG
ncbi:MAG TPA: autotransporter-associated beta strand repeat-containing protein, partial [Chthoniobacterales bacterium]